MRNDWLFSFLSFSVLHSIFVMLIMFPGGAIMGRKDGLSQKTGLEKVTVVSISLPPSTLAKIDRIASKARISRSQLISNLLAVGLDNAIVADAIGLTALIGGVRDLKEQLLGADRVEGAQEV
jgi:hypothetical protein